MHIYHTEKNQTAIPFYDTTNLIVYRFCSACFYLGANVKRGLILPGFYCCAAWPFTNTRIGLCQLPAPAPQPVPADLTFTINNNVLPKITIVTAEGSVHPMNNPRLPHQLQTHADTLLHSPPSKWHLKSQKYLPVYTPLCSYKPFVSFL